MGTIKPSLAPLLENIKSSTRPLIPQAPCSNGRGGYPSGQKQTGYRKHELTCRGGDKQLRGSPTRNTASTRLGKCLAWTPPPETGGDALQTNGGGGLSSHKRQGPPLLLNWTATSSMPLHLVPQTTGILGGEMASGLLSFLPLWCKNKRAKRHCA